jgi:hypothetical protein
MHNVSCNRLIEWPQDRRTEKSKARDDEADIYQEKGEVS